MIESIVSIAFILVVAIGLWLAFSAELDGDDR